MKTFNKKKSRKGRAGKGSGLKALGKVLVKAESASLGDDTIGDWTLDTAPFAISHVATGHWTCLYVILQLSGVQALCITPAACCKYSSYVAAFLGVDLSSADQGASYFV